MIIIPKAIVVFLIIFLMTFATSHHANASEFLDRTTLLAELNSGQWSELEKKFNTLQKSFEVGDVNDMYIEHALDTFAHSSSQTLIALNEWVKSHPDSAFAYAARGVHYWRIYWHGSENESLSLNKSEDVLSRPEGFIYKGDELEKARADFKKSISLNSRLALPYAYLINLAMSERSQIEKGIAYRNALNNVPDSDGVRWRYFYSLIPHWGGQKNNVKLEIKIADYFAKKKGHAGPPINFLQYYEAIQKQYDGDRETASKLFEQTITENTRWYVEYDYVNNLRKTKEYDKALSAAQTLSTRHPQNPLILSSIAEAYCNLNRYEEAFKFWEKATAFDPHDPDLLDYSAWCRIEWGRKISNGTIVTTTTTAEEQYEHALADMRAATKYAGNTRKIRFRQASILTYQLKRYEEALLDTQYLLELQPKNSKYINLHSQVHFGLHNCEFNRLDRKLLDICQKGSCTKFHRDSANWRLSTAASKGWCK